MHKKKYDRKFEHKQPWMWLLDTDFWLQLKFIQKGNHFMKQKTHSDGHQILHWIPYSNRKEHVDLHWKRKTIYITY